MSEIKFLAFADLHNAAGYYNQGAERMQKIADHAIAENVDMVLHCGDLTHGPTMEPEPRVVPICDSLPVPVLHSFGNHECDNSSYEEVLAAYHMENGYYYRDVKGFRFIAYDAHHMIHHGEFIHYSKLNYWHPPHGIREPETVMDVLGEEQIAWIEKTIMASPYPCILFGHHSWVRHWAGLIPEERKAVKKMLRRVNKDKQRVMMVMCGHYHTDYMSIEDNVVHFELNSTSNQWFPQTHDKFPTEITDNARSTRNTLIYNDPVHCIITLRDDGTINIKGMESSWFYDVSPESLGYNSTDPSGRPFTPDVLSASIKLDMSGWDNIK